LLIPDPTIQGYSENARKESFYVVPGFAGQSGDSIPKQVALFRVVTRDYFPTIGARLREGRFFEISDRRSESPVAIVNETFADRNFPGRSPVGAQLKFGHLDKKGYWYTIVGVVKEIRERGDQTSVFRSRTMVHFRDQG